MRAMLLAIVLLAGCTTQSGLPFALTGIVADAHFPGDLVKDDVERAARALGWRPLGGNESGWRGAYTNDTAQFLVWAPRPDGWDFHRSFTIEAERFASSAEANARADALWPDIERQFAQDVATFEAAGNWSHDEIRHTASVLS